MKGLIVSVVDVLGIFVPGFLLLMGILLNPSVVNDILKEWSNWPQLLKAVGENLSVIGILVAIISYVFGFIIRLFSITIMQFLTFPLWAKKLKKRARNLEAALKVALKNEEVCKGLEEEAKLRSKIEVAHNAPYFVFSKRLIQNGNSTLWTGTERMEAELRFMSGIFIPLIMLSVDGIFMSSNLGRLLSLVTGLGFLIILASFPSRRIKEVIYNYHMALIVLHYPSKSSKADNGGNA